MSKKITYEFVKEQFEKENWILKSTEYINNIQKLECVCPRGHKCSISWGNWQQGHRCLFCAGNAKLDINFIRSEFKKENYKLSTEIYINNRQKLFYTCPNGHKHSVSWDEWSHLGNRCPHCAGLSKPTIEFIREQFEKEEWVLRSTEYVNAKQKLDCVCPNGHKCSIAWGNWKTGKRCPMCAGNVKHAIEFIRSEFEKESWILKSTEYMNAHQKLNCICPNGHKHSISWHNWQQNKRCPHCVVTASKGEIEIRDFVKFLGIKVSANDKNQIFNPDTNRKFELDIFMPNLNKAIEYNGEYWHRNKKNRDNNDLLKQQLCKSKDIDLLTIWDKQWKTQNNVCKNKIMKFIFD